MSEVLDGGLHLVISEKIDGISGGVQFFLEHGFEWVHDKSGLEVGVGGENFGGVHFLHFEGPWVEHDNLLSEVDDAYVGEFLPELSDSFLSEVGWDEEVAVGDQKVGERFLDVALDGLLEGLVDLAEVSALVEQFGVELLESAFVSLNFAHLLVIGFVRVCL
jgi:hypothetical protein